MPELELTLTDEIDFLTDDKWEPWIENLLLLAQKEVGLTDNLEMSITFVTPARIQEINREYRNKDNATDVISFAINDDDDLDFDQFADFEGFTKDIGDLFICIDVVREHGEEYGHGFEREFGYTLVHGFLHLNGYDHIKDDEREEMINLQNKILNDYGLER